MSSAALAEHSSVARMSGEEPDGPSSFAAGRAAHRAASKKKKTTHKRLADLLKHVTEGAEYAEELVASADDMLSGSSEMGAAKMRVADMVERASRGEPIEGENGGEKEEGVDDNQGSDGGASDDDSYDDSESDDRKAHRPMFCPPTGQKSRHRTRK